MGISNKRVIYISGPMTGLPNYNYDEFNRVASILKRMGYKVINPADTGVREGWIWRDYLTKDLIDLLSNNVSIVVTLDGWENSKGARLEVHVAKELGMDVIPVRDFLSMHGLRG